MKPKLAMVLAALTAVTAIAVPGVVAGADTVVECSGDFPIFQSTAANEDENQARIACVEDRKDTIHERIASGREKRREITQRIEALKHRRQDVNARIAQAHIEMAPLNQVDHLLQYVVGEIDWINVTSGCESGGDPERHDASGDHHGKGQFLISTWTSLEWAKRYGSDDPHTEPAIVQDAGMVELKDRSGDEQWPYCGDLAP